MSGSPETPLFSTVSTPTVKDNPYLVILLVLVVLIVGGLIGLVCGVGTGVSVRACHPGRRAPRRSKSGRRRGVAVAAGLAVGLVSMFGDLARILACARRCVVLEAVGAVAAVAALTALTALTALAALDRPPFRRRGGCNHGVGEVREGGGAD